MGVILLAATLIVWGATKVFPGLGGPVLQQIIGGSAILTGILLLIGK